MLQAMRRVMGQHQVPQYYLKGFAEPNKYWIHRYEKNSGKVQRIPVKDAAQERGFYTEEAEKYLSEAIEGPGNKVLKKLRNRVAINFREKFDLATYILVMAKRVPYERERLKAQLPETMDSVFKEVEHEIEEAVANNPKLAPVADKKRADLRQLREKYELEVPLKVWCDILPPKRTSEALAMLFNMNWLFLESDADEFLTSDNPVYLGIGIKPPEGELTFPLNSGTALFASWKVEIDNAFCKVGTQVVNEFNRRTVVSASRHVYHRNKADWVRALSIKKDLKLNRINLKLNLRGI
jgi:hypothetical protein